MLYLGECSDRNICRLYTRFHSLFLKGCQRNFFWVGLPSKFNIWHAAPRPSCLSFSFSSLSTVVRFVNNAVLLSSVHPRAQGLDLPSTSLPSILFDCLQNLPIQLLTYFLTLIIYCCTASFCHCSNFVDPCSIFFF